MRRNLLFISHYTGLGGGERIQLNLMGALDPARYAVHLVCPREGQFPQAARERGAQVHILPFRGVTTVFVPALWMRLPISRRLADLVRAHDIHLIHSDYHALPFAVAAGEAAGVPAVWNAIGWWFPVHPWQRAFFAQRVDQIVAITRAVRDRWLGDPPRLPPDQIPVITPGVDPDEFRPGAADGSAIRAQMGIGSDAPLVALLARFQQVKGHDVFHAMAQRVVAEIPEARFAVAGENVFGASKDEAYKRAMLAHAQQDPVLRAALTHLGFQDARAVLAAADVLVCPSRFESLGMVHLEAMAMGVPVVSTDNGGPAETVVDRATGFLVPPDDPGALAERVLRLLRDPALRARLGAAGRARVLAQFTARGYADRMAELFERVIAQHR